MPYTENERLTAAFEVVSYLRVVGRDNEMADFDNPRGEIIREVFNVRVEFVDGERWDHNYCSQDRARIERLHARIVAAVASGDDLDPAHWVETDPAYGSLAYQMNEADIVAREREEA